MKFVSRDLEAGCKDLYKDVQRCAKMCKDVQRFFYSEMVAPFLSFDGRGPSLCVELVTMNFGT